MLGSSRFKLEKTLFVTYGQNPRCPKPTKSDTPEHMPNSGVNKAKLVFHLFDSNHGGTVSKVLLSVMDSKIDRFIQTEVLDVLRYMVGTNIGNENLDAIAERVMVEGK